MIKQYRMHSQRGEPFMKNRFLKKYPCYYVLIFKLADSFVYIFATNCQFFQITVRVCPITLKILFRDIEILGWCPAGPSLPHAEKVPL